ncbi:MAG: hypothetical protein IKY16_10655 [Bacteroidales bacterium]|nr:hypothetical protein [Bacteroidales bacterium]
MARDRNIYKPLRRKHGEGVDKFATVGLKKEVAQEFKFLVKAYSEVFGQKMTPTQVIKRLMDAGVKRCDPDVHAVFSRLKEAGTPEPVLESDPTKGDVWERRYFAVKDGDKIELLVGDKQPFYGKFNGKDVGLWKFLQEGYTFMNDAGLEINEEQAKIISGQIKEQKNNLD